MLVERRKEPRPIPPKSLYENSAERKGARGSEPQRIIISSDFNNSPLVSSGNDTNDKARSTDRDSHLNGSSINPFESSTTAVSIVGGWLVTIQGLLSTVIVDYDRHRAIRRAVEQHEKTLAVYYSGFSLR